ncbi:hypothetical protein Rs2_41614 [Raphanus sativus]|nr:hypothetical protein Rs2_41614 [Raphanus sativus]
MPLFGRVQVSLQVYIVDYPKETIIEILQSEKLQDMTNFLIMNTRILYGNLLTWLILLDNTVSQQPCSLPPRMSSTPEATACQLCRRQTLHQLLRSHVTERSQVSSKLKPSFDLEAWDS